MLRRELRMSIIASLNDAGATSRERAIPRFALPGRDESHRSHALSELQALSIVAIEDDSVFLTNAELE